MSRFAALLLLVTFGVFVFMLVLFAVMAHVLPFWFLLIIVFGVAAGAIEKAKRDVH